MLKNFLTGSPLFWRQALSSSSVGFLLFDVALFIGDAVFPRGSALPFGRWSIWDNTRIRLPPLSLLYNIPDTPHLIAFLQHHFDAVGVGGAFG